MNEKKVKSRLFVLKFFVFALEEIISCTFRELCYCSCIRLIIIMCNNNMVELFFSENHNSLFVSHITHHIRHRHSIESPMSTKREYFWNWQNALSQAPLLQHFEFPMWYLHSKLWCRFSYHQRHHHHYDRHHSHHIFVYVASTMTDSME